MEALHPGIGIHECARGFAERRNRQHHVGKFVCDVLERGHHDDHLGSLHCNARGSRVGGVECGFDVQQHEGLQCRTGQHLTRVQAAALRHRANELRADGIGGLGQVADAGTGLRADPVREREQRAGLRVLRRRVAQQDRLALAARERCGDSFGFIGRVAAHRRLRAVGNADRGGDIGQRLHPAARRNRGLRRHRHQPVVVRSVKTVHLRALARGLADALREQRVIFAQKGTDDQHALQVRQRSDARA